MKIKKNGVTINLTESEVKKLSKRILKEQQIVVPSNYDKLSNALMDSLEDGGDVIITYKASDSKYVYLEFTIGGKETSLKIPISDVSQILPPSP